MPPLGERALKINFFVLYLVLNFLVTDFIWRFTILVFKTVFSWVLIYSFTCRSRPLFYGGISWVLFIWARLTGLARLPGCISPWVHMRNFSPVSEMRKGQRSWVRVLAPNLGNKANIEKHKIFYFRASVTLKAVSLQLNGMLMMCKIQQAMKDDAIRTTRIHPAVHSANRDEVFIWQNFQPPCRDLGWKNRDLGNRTSPPSHMNTSKIFQRI